MKDVGIGIVGAGFVADIHAESIQRHVCGARVTASP